MSQMEALADAGAVNKDWWRGAVIYQIYPRSYQDSNSDGIGDLAGIVHRLKYIADIGVDAIWISPFFRSPMLDFGYDVSDYRDIDPMFGTLGDFDILLKEAHKLGVKILIDLVLSHSSDQHPWFQESSSSKTNPKADWYVWADAKPDGTPPNNWLSIFGGSAWEWNAERMQYYLHNFLTSQPDLNMHNPQVQQEMLDIVRYWLDRGVDGFRLDTINFYFHDTELRDNPALPVEDRNDTIAPAVNPYNWQDHQYDKNRPENLDFLRKMRAVMDEYPAATMVGEVGDGQYGMEIQAQYTSGTDKVHMCYDFAFLSNSYPSGTRIADVLTRFADVNKDGWACWAFSNHDVTRHATRWNLSEQASKVYAALLLSLRGSVCLYQGEELGLTEAFVPFEDLQDPYGIRFWPNYRGRDGCRTPIPWVADNAHGGFSDAKPWLPVAVEHLDRSVANQQDKPGSMLSFYQNMIGFRSTQPALITGALDLVGHSDAWISLIRTHEAQRLFCAFNLSDQAQDISLPDGSWTSIEGVPFETVTVAKTITLPPYQAFFARDANA